MIRKAFVMQVHPGREREYAARHERLWFELERTLLEHGVVDYSIFLHPGTRQLFAYVVVESEERWAAIARTEACRRWWRHNAELMPSTSDGRPHATDLVEVFHLERERGLDRG